MLTKKNSGYDVDRSNRLSFDEFLQMLLEASSSGSRHNDKGHDGVIYSGDS